MLATYHPTEAAIEDLSFGKNKKTAIAVAHARGVILLAIRTHHIPIATYTPTEVKLAVTGMGLADKAQAGELVRVLLSLEMIPRPDDAADAATVAMCHTHIAAWRSKHARENVQ